MLAALHFDAQNFSRFTLCVNFERPAAHLAIGSEPLGRDAGVNRQLERLAAKGANDSFNGFHCLS